MNHALLLVPACFVTIMPCTWASTAPQREKLMPPHVPGQSQCCGSVYTSGNDAVAGTRGDQGQRKSHLADVINKNDVPKIEFLYVPPFGSIDNLIGRVSGVNPTNYSVAVYIYVSGWWTKPTWAEPLTPIAIDGTWVCDITTGGYDRCATKIIAFLVPDYFDPPLGQGQQCLAFDLYQYPHEEAIRYKKISFSGCDWLVKRHCDTVGPGPNYFSDSDDNVWVDPNGHLHMRIAQRDDIWYCSEIIAENSFGYGTYAFTVQGRIDLLDENIILGLFTWEDCVPEHNYRELDVELSSCQAWRESPADVNNAQFVVQPWDRPGNRHRFNVDLADPAHNITTHEFTWRAEEVSFRSYYGDFSLSPSAEDTIESWNYSGDDTPPPGAENPRINFWLLDGNAPTDGQDAEIVVKSFQYLPARMLTTGTMITTPVTGVKMIVAGYDDGTLEFRDWQGNLLVSRFGFGEITALDSSRCADSPLPRLFVGSTDAGGALRIIDPDDINHDLASRIGFGRITALSVDTDGVYVGSDDTAGTLRKLNSTTLNEEDYRFGFGQITAVVPVRNVTNYLLVGSTDLGGTLRIVDLDTLDDVSAPRFGFGTIYDSAAGDIDRNSIDEIAVASSDSGGTVRYLEADDLSLDKEVRYGFSSVYAVAYGFLGMSQCAGNGKASVVVASSDTDGAVRVIEVDTATLTATPGYSADRFGFATVAALDIICSPYLLNPDLLCVISTDGGTIAAHITNENIHDLSLFQIP